MLDSFPCSSFDLLRVVWFLPTSGSVGGPRRRPTLHSVIREISKQKPPTSSSSRFLKVLSARWIEGGKKDEHLPLQRASGDPSETGIGRRVGRCRRSLGDFASAFEDERKEGKACR